MKKFIKFGIVLSLSLLLITVISFGCFAAATKVEYSGNSGDFIFTTNSNDNPTDLFENFKDVMPGDVLTQDIVVKNNADKKVDVEIFLKSFGADKDSIEFLDKLGLVVCDESGKVLSDDKASKAGSLSEFVSLGKFASGTETNLKVKLTVPADLTNEHAKEIGRLKWQFKVDEKPVEVPVQTSDYSNILYYALALVSGATFLVLLLVLRRKSKVQ